MRVIGNVTLISVVAVALALIPDAGMPQTAAKAKEAPTMRVLTAEKVNKRQFDRQLNTLPDNAVVETAGRRVTVGDIRAKTVEMQKMTIAEAEANAKASTARFAARQGQLAQQRMAKLDADNAKVQPQLTQLSRTEAIRVEAAELMRKSKSATPAELAKLEERAAQLLRELHAAVPKLK
jgi:hypothetical protein